MQINLYAYVQVFKRSLFLFGLGKYSVYTNSDYANSTVEDNNHNFSNVLKYMIPQKLIKLCFHGHVNTSFFIKRNLIGGGVQECFLTSFHSLCSINIILLERIYIVYLYICCKSLPFTSAHCELGSPSPRPIIPFTSGTRFRRRNQDQELTETPLIER